MHKTQVFVNPFSDHFRTRLTHTLEVAQIARTVARALCLNEDLTEAIALGHDLGHTPFGHAGERALASVYPGFAHQRHSLRIVDCLEKDRQGLNLSAEVRDGISKHSGNDGMPATVEGCVVRLCDRIAYLNHDIDDAIRAGMITEAMLPAAALYFGSRNSERINAMICDVVATSQGQALVAMSAEAQAQLDALRSFMFTHVYYHPDKLKEEAEVQRMVVALYHYYLQHLSEIPAEYLDASPARAVCDYLAGMTDSFALRQYREIFGH